MLKRFNFYKITHFDALFKVLPKNFIRKEVSFFAMIAFRPIGNVTHEETFQFGDTQLPRLIR